MTRFVPHNLTALETHTEHVSVIKEFKDNMFVILVFFFFSKTHKRSFSKYFQSFCFKD